MNNIEKQSNILIVSNTSASELSDRIAMYLSALLKEKVERRTMPYKEHANTEVDAQFNYSVRGKNVYVINDVQSGTDEQDMPSINDNLMQALLMINGFKENGAAQRTLVMPFFPYGRQDKQDYQGLRKKDKRVPAGYRMVHDMIQLAGANNIVTMDIHNPVDISRDINFIKIPIGWMIKQVVNQIQEENLIMSTTDIGGGTKLRAVGDDLDLPVIVVDKRRDYTANSKVKEIKINADEHEYLGKTVLIYDDMIDTAGTLCKVIDAYEAKGSKDIYVVSTNPILDGNALGLLEERYNRGAFKRLYVTNSIYHKDLSKLYPWIKIIDSAPILANTLHSIETGQEIDYNNDTIPEGWETYEKVYDNEVVA